MRVLELGSYVLPAYAGMVLAEQGALVTKWTHPEGRPDPVQSLRRGDELWAWINHAKHLEPRHAREAAALAPGSFDIVIDNVRAEAWKRWNVDPAFEADRLGVAWVSMRDEFDGRSFDAVTQARALMEHVPYLPIYIGDTSGGLWMAFKALAMTATSTVGHRVLRQSSCLAKLVEGELVVTEPRDDAPPWDEPGTYGAAADGTRVVYRGEEVIEPVRDTEWKLRHLNHDGTGRIRI
ncbi:CoA transferase [Promicromonospora panici]|uniref:CoA transferase n=1 Tax=Promicromonospora panici TaxID=2219658 RepID=UPI00101B85A8|nr:CoA transferase [Promicromonospora panici]